MFCNSKVLGGFSIAIISVNYASFVEADIRNVLKKILICKTKLFGLPYRGLKYRSKAHVLHSVA